MKIKPKRCEFCCEIFLPHHCVGARQRACGKSKCKQDRRTKSQTEWLEKNPGYFKGRYPQLEKKIKNRSQNLKKSNKQNAPPNIQDELTDNNYIILTSLENIQDKLSPIFNETNSQIYKLNSNIQNIQDK